ncbi:kdo(2)-lipid A phosphoethanolamine 7''-transferase [Escherichia coli]
MRYIKSITQQKLSFLLAIYIGLFMNGAVFYRRFGSYAHDFTVWKGVSAVVELAATVLVTFFLLRLLSLFGRRSWRILASLVVLFSAGASYYMTFLNVVIGYGIIASVMTTDIDLSKEVVGLNFILWLIAVSALPLILIWNNRCRYTLLRQLRTPGQRIRSLAVVVLAGIMVWAPIRLLDIQQKKVERATGVDLPSYGGVVANSYLPSNWLSALGLYAWARVDESSDNNSLLNPAKKFTYQAPQNVDDTYVVFIIGETTRWDHMGIFGYERNTTPKLAQEKNLAAFRGYSCDTATKLSLRCMFVRQGGAEDNPQRTLKEQNIFAVLKQLGFSSDLYAMQSEMWFYSNTMADNIAYREQIGAEPRNRGKPVDDMLLVDEMQQSLGRNPDGKHLIILHTKGSHFNYTQRYPRSFAQWKPECIGVDSGCTKAQMINSYDNSVTYVDHFISSVIDQVRDKKAIVFYAADHGESINEREHLHGTPRELAPPEQFRVPMMVWMSDKYLENPANAQAFAQLKKEADMKVPRRHVELYDTIMGCLGYTSPDGGINENNMVDEMQQSLGRNPDGKHLIILHTKGSHFNYTQRYPRSFAQWKPECIGVDSGCTKAQMINSYDNSVTYVDHFISSVIDQVRDKKAIVFYAADHGESINEREHLHGTPRELAPPEQFRVPMMVWMSDKYLENPANAQAFAQLKKEADMKVPRRHVELYDTIMGCLGYTSPDGGINENNNWCHIPQTKVAAAN